MPMKRSWSYCAGSYNCAREHYNNMHNIRSHHNYTHDNNNMYHAMEHTYNDSAYLHSGYYYPPTHNCPGVQYNSRYLSPHQQHMIASSPATFVADGIGNAYYVTDFETHYEMPIRLLPVSQFVCQNQMGTPTATTAGASGSNHHRRQHYFNRQQPRLTLEEYEDEEEPQAEGVPYRDEIVQNEVQSLSRVDAPPPTRQEAPKRGKNPNVYRSEEGYLVEEPLEPSEPSDKDETESEERHSN